MKIIKGNIIKDKNTGYDRSDFWIRDGGKSYFYRLNCRKTNKVSIIQPVKIFTGVEISWYDLPIEVKKMHIKTSAPYLYEQKRFYRASYFWNNIVVLPSGDKFVFVG